MPDSEEFFQFFYAAVSAIADGKIGEAEFESMRDDDSFRITVSKDVRPMVTEYHSEAE